MLFSAVPAAAGPDPDELYRAGRYTEAAKAYGERDMERPKTHRYRYNRGVAAYRAGDAEGAGAAFASALRRAGEGEGDIAYRAAFNLGVLAYEAKNYAGAAAHFVRALRERPGDADAAYNLEAALRAREEAEKARKEQEGKDGGQDQEEKDEQEHRKGEQPGNDGQDKDDGRKEQAQNEPPKGGKAGQQEQSPQPGAQESAGEEGGGERQEPETGGGAAAQAAPSPVPGEEAPEVGTEDGHAAAVDRARAAALLDNVKENRGLLMQMQAAGAGETAAPSGKTW